MEPYWDGYIFLMLRTITCYLRTKLSQRTQTKEIEYGRYGSCRCHVDVREARAWLPSTPQTRRRVGQDKTLMQMGPTYWLLNPSTLQHRKWDTFQRVGGIGTL
jgi:hypothetical protein